MRRLRITGQWSSEIVEAEPVGLEPAQVRIQIAACGVCHSDIGEIGDPAVTPGVGLGHELAGTVSESRSEAFAVGDHVAVLDYEGYATEVVADAERVLPVPEGVPLDLAALAEPVACVLAGIDRVSLRGVTRVAVVGAGFMGLVLTRALAIRGLDVDVYELRAENRKQALSQGAVAVFASPAETDENSYAVVFECTGAPSGLEVASALVAIEGTLSIVGYHQSNGGIRQIPLQSWNYRALDVVNAHTRSPDEVLLQMRRALRMMQVGAIDLQPLITGRVPFDDVPGVLRADGAPSLRDHVKLVAEIG